MVSQLAKAKLHARLVMQVAFATVLAQISHALKDSTVLVVSKSLVKLVHQTLLPVAVSQLTPIVLSLVMAMRPLSQVKCLLAPQVSSVRAEPRLANLMKKLTKTVECVYLVRCALAQIPLLHPQPLNVLKDTTVLTMLLRLTKPNAQLVSTVPLDLKKVFRVLPVHGLTFALQELTVSPVHTKPQTAQLVPILKPEVPPHFWIVFSVPKVASVKLKDWMLHLLMIVLPDISVIVDLKEPLRHLAHVVTSVLKAQLLRSVVRPVNTKMKKLKVHARLAQSATTAMVRTPKPTRHVQEVAIVQREPNTMTSTHAHLVPLMLIREVKLNKMLVHGVIVATTASSMVKLLRKLKSARVSMPMVTPKMAMHIRLKL